MEAEVEAPKKPKAQPWATRKIKGPNDKDWKEVPYEIPDANPGQASESAYDRRTVTQILNGEIPKPAELDEQAKKVEEQKQLEYQQREQQALYQYHLARARILAGSPEMFSLDELQAMSDLLPARTSSFENWWRIQLAREVEAKKAQPK